MHCSSAAGAAGAACGGTMVAVVAVVLTRRSTSSSLKPYKAMASRRLLASSLLSLPSAVAVSGGVDSVVLVLALVVDADEEAEEAV